MCMIPIPTQEVESGTLLSDALSLAGHARAMDLGRTIFHLAAHSSVRVEFEFSPD